VPGLVGLLRDGSAGAQEGAARYLRNLACDASLLVPLHQQEGLVPGLVGLLRDGSAGAQERAALCLCNLARDASLRLSLFRQLVHEPILV
jgi:hypothetical protein